MFIYGLHISNFRGLSDLWFFPNPDLNVLIGPNNSGKTSILTALKLVLDPSVNFRRDDVISQFDFFQGDILKPIEIKTWLRLNNTETEEIKRRFNHKLSAWQRQTDKLEPFTIEPLTPDDAEQSFLELLALELKIEWDADLNIAKPELIVFDETHTERHTLSLEDREFIGYRFFPSRRDPLYQFSMGRYSLISKSIPDKTISTELRKIQHKLEELKGGLLNTEELKLLLTNLSKMMSPEILGGFANFTLTFLDSNLSRLRGATSLALEKNETKKKDIGDADPDLEDVKKSLLPLSSLGDGIQNLLLLLQVSKMTSSKAGQQTIIALEEPEQNLEPSLAKWAFTELCKNFSQSRYEESNYPAENGQLFITTHSPALIAELKGADSICRISRPDRCSNNKARHVIVGTELGAEIRKSLEQYRDKYSYALLAQHALIVDGASEEGLLPVFFNALADEPGKNPFHLGLAIVNGGGSECWRHAKYLRGYGLTTHTLMDFDIPEKKCKDENIKDLVIKNSDFVCSWPNESPLSFAGGYDIEIMLVTNIPANILFDAIKQCYEDAGHELNDSKWDEAKKEFIGINNLPGKFPDINTLDLNSLGDEKNQKAFLLAALHGPHDCKNTKDMRTIAEYITKKNTIPTIIEGLRKRVVECMINPPTDNSIFLLK